ncbi:sugar ABC transporter substrate-binding protein [Mediterraneibacter sp. NSJ-55]|uniref:Sugar ABC transporter substrate-binding protein n=1 Tax=Mediterraneibacter hominis TaxID=2763054 RepID=A0A923LJ91_9FIRM|nr:sugar ABC transporter substrate-binding protein [Mediterraneibacter hominis]MBC5689863.1 sugar ABC transporter substrate-binding protein [Mediterraneibacter hominis]
MKKRLKSIVGIMMCMLLLLTVTACGNKEKEKEGSNGIPIVRVGVSWHEKQSTNVTVWSDYMKQFGEEKGPEYGVEFEWIEVVGDGTPVQETSNIQDLINQQVDVMVIWCNNAETIGESIKKAQDAGIKVVTLDHQDSGKLADAHVGQETLEQSVIAAEALADILEEDGVKDAKAIELFGSTGDPNSVNRSGGWAQVEEERGMWETVTTVPTEWKTENFKSGLSNALAANPDAEVLFLASDFAFSAVQAALEEAGRWEKRGEAGHMYICTQDINPEAYPAFVDGYIDAGVPFDNIAHAEKVVEVVADLYLGNTVEKENWIVTPAVTSDNIETEPSVWARDYLKAE